MLKFYPIIWKSIAGLSDRADREAVYEQSRALLRATQATDSALTPEQIAAQAHDLEEAIARAEREREKLVRRQGAARASANFAKQVMPLELPSPPLPPPADAIPESTPSEPADAEPVSPSSQAPAKRRSSVPIARPLALAALALVVIVPVASWLYLRNPRPAPSAATKTVAAARPALVESATLYRGGDRIAGTVSWRKETALAANGSDAGFRVDATFEPLDQFPDGLRLTLSLGGNAAPGTIPAAQIAEIRFTSKSGQPAEVRAAPGILLRTKETESGQPLLGLTAKSSVPGLFIVAASATDRDIDANVALLRGTGWIDIPFVDDAGAPGVISMAAGAGRSVIRDTLKAWSESAR